MFFLKLLFASWTQVNIIPILSSSIQKLEFLQAEIWVVSQRQKTNIYRAAISPILTWHGRATRDDISISTSAQSGLTQNQGQGSNFQVSGSITANFFCFKMIFTFSACECETQIKRQFIIHCTHNGRGLSLLFLSFFFVLFLFYFCGKRSLNHKKYAFQNSVWIPNLSAFLSEPHDLLIAIPVNPKIYPHHPVVFGVAVNKSEGWWFHPWLL